MKLMRHCLGVNLLGLHILGTVIVCGFPEAQYRRPQQAPPLVLDLKVQQRPFTSFRNTPSHTTRPAFPPQQVEPGYPRVPQLLPFTPQDARPFTPYIRTLPEQRKLVDRDAPTVNKQQIPHFLLQNAKLPKKSRDISMNEASYLMVMTKPQHESMQDYALLESADDISKPNAPNEVPLPYPETPKFTSTISEMSEVSITTPKPKVARRPNSQIISTTPTSSTLDSPPVVRVTKSSRVSSSKGKKPSVVKQQLSEHRESKRSPQQLDLHYIPSFRRRQGGNGGISNLASHISGNIYGGRQYPVVPIPEISHHQHYGGINTLMGYGLQYPSTPVPFSTVPTLYGGHINQIPITYRIPMYTTGASLLPSQTFGIPNLSPFQESLLSPYYRTPEYQMVQPLVALNYMNGNPIVPNYESYPVSTPYYPLVTSHPGYHLQQHLNNFPIYEEAIQKNNTNIYRHSQEEDDLHRFIEKQRRPSVTQVRQPPNGHFPPVFMKQRPTTISYPHPLGILARFPEDISLPPIYRPPSDSRSAFSNGFTPVAILPQGYDFQNGMNLPFSPEESPIIDSHTDSKEKDSKFSKSQSDRVPEQQSNENVSQPMNTFKEETSDHSGESEDSSNSDRERRVAPFPQNRKFTGLSKELTVHDKETNGITPIIKVVNAQDRSFTEQPSSQLQHHKSDHRTPSVSAYFFSTNSNKPSYHHLHHDNNNAYVFSINDPRFLEQLKRLRSQQKSLKKLPKRKKPKSTLTCRGLFGEVIPGCKPRRHRKNPQRKPPKTSIVQGYDILKGGVFTPKSTLTDRVSHLVPQTESFQHPLLPPNTIPLSQAEQSLLRYGPRIWRPVYQVPMANKYPVYSRRQMKTMHHHGISPHGHPAWKRGQLDNFRMQTSLNSQLFKSSHFSPILSTRIYMNTT